MSFAVFYPEREEVLIEAVAFYLKFTPVAVEAVQRPQWGAGSSKSLYATRVGCKTETVRGQEGEGP